MSLLGDKQSSAANLQKNVLEDSDFSLLNPSDPPSLGIFDDIDFRLWDGDDEVMRCNPTGDSLFENEEIGKSAAATINLFVPEQCGGNAASPTLLTPLPSPVQVSKQRKTPKWMQNEHDPKLTTEKKLSIIKAKRCKSQRDKVKAIEKAKDARIDYLGKREAQLEKEIATLRQQLKLLQNQNKSR